MRVLDFQEDERSGSPDDGRHGSLTGLEEGRERQLPRDANGKLGRLGEDEQESAKFS